MQVIIQKRVVPADGQDNVHVAQMLQALLAMQIRQEVAGIMEIDIFVMVAVKQVLK